MTLLQQDSISSLPVSQTGHHSMDWKKGRQLFRSRSCLKDSEFLGGQYQENCHCWINPGSSPESGSGICISSRSRNSLITPQDASRAESARCSISDRKSVRHERSVSDLWSHFSVLWSHISDLSCHMHVTVATYACDCRDHSLAFPSLFK